MIIRARSPLRISFGGGGTDIPPYCDDCGGAVLSATINRYAFATLMPGLDTILVRSLDYDASISYNINDQFIYDGQLDLAKAVLNYYRNNYGLKEGLELYLHNDAPPGSGLGSSSAITVAMIAALAEYLRIPMDSYQVADLAFHLERNDVGIKGGKQDQYGSAFGGFSFIEFNKGTTVVNSLRIRPEVICELEYSLVFAYVGGQHLSSHIIDKQINNYKNAQIDSIRAMDKLKGLAYEMKKVLLLGRLGDFGTLMNEAWENKKLMAEGITTPYLDEVYEEAKKAGALGGKVSGAGGGGFMFFFCDPRKRFAVQERLRQIGTQVVNLSFVNKGVQTWTL